MAWYGIGDIQGCYQQLTALLSKIGYKAGIDQLWLCGDLVNRGPRSADVLRWAQDQGDLVQPVLGNHDLHVLAIAYGIRVPGPRDTVADILEASDADQLITWLRRQPLMVCDPASRSAMVHAGLVPQWSSKLAQELAEEVHTVLRSDRPETLLANMYGDRPKKWRPSLRGAKRLRFIVNVFTRLRYCSRRGKLILYAKGRPETTSSRMIPWYLHPQRKSTDTRLIFGHWSTLGIQRQANTLSLDSGCLWGGRLTAVRLDSEQPIFYSVPCPGARSPR